MRRGGGRQPRHPLLQRGRPALDIEDVYRVRQVRVGGGLRGPEPLAELVRPDGVVHLQVDPPDAKIEVAEGAITVRPRGEDEPYTITVPKGGGKLRISKAGFTAETSDVTLRDKGTTIIVEHGGGDYSIYGSLARADVRLHETVTKGEQLGTVGISDPDLPPHLHFEIRHGGPAVDPASWLRGER